MSQVGSDDGIGDRYGLPTEVLSRLGNLNPVGLPFFRDQPFSQDEEERLSLVESSLLEQSDDGSDTELLPTSQNYGATRSIEGITLAWRELSATVQHPSKTRVFGSRSNRVTKVLNNVSGAVRPGSLLALMGSSGAGKSTLMNALAQRTPSAITVNGDILVNGQRADETMARLAGYVHQHDLFVGSLTVKEHLTFMARLRMDRHTTKQDRLSRVNELMRDLGIAKSKDTRIGIPNQDKSLSGGERKRLAFATEIITDPPLLFCDEPTTGLDSFNARKLVKMMKEMAARGKTIVCTIHQPSSEVFAMFDRLLLLAEGRVAYCGTSQGALTFFESLGHKCPSTFNPADFYIHNLAMLPNHEMSSRARIRRIADNFAVSEHAKELESIISEQESLLQFRDGTNSEENICNNIPKKVLWHVQMYWLTWRSFVDSYRNPAIHTLRILQKTLMALIIGACYTNVRMNQEGIQNIQGVLFTFITENTFPSLYGVLNIFPQELPLFLREYKNGIYRSDTYYLSKMISLIPGYIVDPLIFVSISYFMVGLRPEIGSFFLSVLTVICTANVASSCGAMFSAMFESIPFCMLVLIPFDIVLLISGGLFINLETMSPAVSWVKYLSWFMYSNEALTVTQWSGISNITCELNDTRSCVLDGEQVISDNSFVPSHLPLDFLFLAALFFGFHFLGFLGLHSRAKRS